MYLTLMILAAVVLPIPVIAASIKRRITPFRAVLEGIIAGVTGAVFFMIMASVTGNPVSDLMKENIHYMAEMLASDPNVQGILVPDLTKAERLEFFVQLYGQAADLLPSSVCVITAVCAYAEYIILSRIVKTDGQRAIPMTKFKDFDLPKNIIMGWFATFLLSWVLTKTGIMPNDLLYININTLFNFVFCLQGMSVLFMFCHKKGAPKAIAVIIIVFFLISGFGKLVLMLLGFTDVIFRTKERLR